MRIRQDFPKFLVLTYHSTGPEPIFSSISSSALYNALSFLKKRYKIISTEELWMRLSKGDDLFNTAVITFDDGHSNMFLHVLPIINSLKIPASFFISTYHCTPGRYLWFSLLQAFRKFYDKDQLYLLGKTWPTKNEYERTTVSNAILQNFKDTDFSELSKFIEQELPPIETFVPKEIIKHYLSGLSADQLKTIADNPYIEIGAHTVTHPFLAKASWEVKKRELYESIDFLHSTTGKKIETFSYPSGSYDSETIKLLRKINIKCAFTTKTIFGSDRFFEIPRVNVSSPSLFSIDLKYRKFQTLFRLAKTIYYKVKKIDEGSYD